jgi:hypothetical protein
MQKSEQTINPRPLFLSILCLFTFFESVSSLWTQSEFLWSPGIRVAQIHEIIKELEVNFQTQKDERAIEMFGSIASSALSGLTAQSVQITAVFFLVFESIVLFALYFMWHREKKGFHLYLLAILISLTLPYFLINGWLAFILVFGLSFKSLFLCLLFYFNLKHMQ